MLNFTQYFFSLQFKHLHIFCLYRKKQIPLDNHLFLQRIFLLEIDFQDKFISKILICLNHLK